MAVTSPIIVVYALMRHFPGPVVEYNDRDFRLKSQVSMSTVHDVLPSSS